MNILYFGTVCDLNKYNELLKNCHSKPSVSTIVFETSLLDGFKKNNIDVEVHSFPMIPTFPYIKQLHFGEIKGELSCGYEYTWLNTINIPILKQITRRISGRKTIKNWIKNNKNKDGVIITYSIPPFLAKDIISYGRKYCKKTIAIVPDLLRDMYINENKKSVITKLKNLYIKPTLKIQNQYDGYIYFTYAMHNVVSPKKPFTVIEGIAETDHVVRKTNKKATPKVIMYAGMLHKKYGVINLIDAFDALADTESQLWLFGDGTAKDEVEERAIKNPRIKYFGVVNHDKVIEYERLATLLVNPRNPEDEFTFYSFPSKTIEYMLSGTPLLTTKLRGIPNDYYNYIFTVDDNSSASLAETLRDILSYSNERLNEIGLIAQEYIINEKNSQRQVAKILDFIKEV